MSRFDILIYLFKDTFVSFRGMKLEIFVSFALHICIVAFLLFAGEYEVPNPDKMKFTTISAVAAPLQEHWKEPPKAGSPKTTKTSNARDISKHQRRKAYQRRKAKYQTPKERIKEPEKRTGKKEPEKKSRRKRT